MKELKKHKKTDERVYNQKLMKNEIRILAYDSLQKIIVVDDDMVIRKRTDEVLGLEVDYPCCQDKF